MWTCLERINASAQSVNPCLPAQGRFFLPLVNVSLIKGPEYSMIQMVVLQNESFHCYVTYELYGILYQ